MPDWLSDFHFLRPGWLLALTPVLAIAWYWARRRSSGSHWESSIAPELLAVLLERGGSAGTRRLPWLIAAALTVGVLGLAGPAWQRLPQPVEQKTDSLVVLFDLSLSMFAQDVAPSRLVRARQKIADVLRRRHEGFTALVAYAGDAHAVVPLTDDVRTIENLLTALRPDMMPVLGSDLGEALEEAHVLFENAGVRQGRILVVTDSVDQMNDATERRDPRFPISILGVGTAAGGAIPLEFVNQPGQVLRSQQGDPIVARVDEAHLASIAELSHGRYHTLSLADDDIEYLLAMPLPGEDETTEVEREFDTWADMGFWAALALIPLVLVGFRRGALVLLPLVLLPPPAQAGLWDDLWQRRDQQAYEALRDGSPDVAAGLFEQKDWRAAALYRSEQYQAAAETYRQNPDTASLYNLGNALAHQQDYARAIDAYDRVLARDPNHEDAAFNRELVKNLQDQQADSQQDQQARQQQGDSEPDDQAQPQGDSESGQDQQGDEQGQPPEQSPEQQREEERSQADEQEQGQEEQLAASRDEKQDALEQWLRRVPDDPGGLLRRKFQYETNQRLRSGDYRSRDSDKIW
jgi:Ca-activated chloride channel family protein